MTPVLFVCSELQRGGAERTWALLVPELRRRGFEPRVLALRDTGPFYDELAAAGIPVATAGMRGRYDLVGLRRAFAAAGHPALVVSQGTNALVVGEAIAVLRRTPHVSIEHGAAELPRRRHRRLLTRLLARSTDRVVAVSDTQLDTLEGMGYDAARTIVVRNGVPRVEPTRARDDVREELGLSADDIAVVLVATLRPEKNLPLFLGAVERAAAREPRIRGFVAGGGPLLERVRDLATGGPTAVLGERRDIPDLLAAADIACLSSRAEALPMVLLEAMALALPTVATDVGGIREVVVDGQTGLLVPAGDVEEFAEALARLARDEGLRRSMGEHAHARYEDLFTLDRMVDGYASVFEDTLADRG